jgi:hypothetical protein
VGVFSWEICVALSAAEPSILLRTDARHKETSSATALFSAANLTLAKAEVSLAMCVFTLPNGEGAERITNCEVTLRTNNTRALLQEYYF